MKSKWIVFLLAIGNVGISMAQDVLSDSVMVDSVSETKPEKKQYYGFFTSNLQTGSNILPQHIFNKLAFGGGMDKEVLSNTANRFGTGQCRFGLYQNFGFSFSSVVREPKLIASNVKDKSLLEKMREDDEIVNDTAFISATGLSKIRISTINYWSVVGSIGGLLNGKISPDAYKLMFMGNGYYRGELLNVGSNKVDQYLAERLDFLLSINRETYYGSSHERTKRESYGLWNYNIAFIEMGVFVGRLTGFQRLKTEVVKVYTSSLADSLSVNGRYNWVRMDENSSGAVMGLSFSNYNLFSRSYYRQLKQVIKFDLKDFGVFYLKDALVSSRGYIWDANGKGFKPAGLKAVQPVSIEQVLITPTKLQQTNWISSEVDRVKEDIGNLDQRRSGFLLMPFQLGIDMGPFGFQYINATGYMPRISLQPEIPASFFSRIISEAFDIRRTEKSVYREHMRVNFNRITAGFSIGGWDKFDINLGWRLYKLHEDGKMLQLHVQANGVEALLAPNVFHGLGLKLSAGISF